MNFDEVMAELHRLAQPEKVEFKQQRYGIGSDNSLGIYQKDLKLLAKNIGLNSELALQLYQTEIYEARLLLPLLYDPELITRTQMNQWVKDFDSWEICDSFCMGFFVKSPHAIPKAKQWAGSSAVFTKRAAFAIMAAYGFAHKTEGNAVFEQFLPLIQQHAGDDRNFVKKAVNWALRSVGKRNRDLLTLATETANTILQEGLDEGDKAKIWVAKDALREFGKESLNVLDYPRDIYRSN